MFNSHSMRLIAHSFPISTAHSGLQIKGQYSGALLVGYFTEVQDCVQLTAGRLIGITTNNPTSKYSMSRELQSIIVSTGMEWPALVNHRPSSAEVIQLAVGAFIHSLSVIGHTKSREAHECDEQFGENTSTDIGKSQSV
jgi:hypothetical protein